VPIATSATTAHATPGADSIDQVEKCRFPLHPQVCADVAGCLIHPRRQHAIDGIASLSMDASRWQAMRRRRMDAPSLQAMRRRHVTTITIYNATTMCGTMYSYRGQGLLAGCHPHYLGQ